MAKLIAAEPLEEAVEAAAEVLEAGGTVVLPTDTVYGIAALPESRAAVTRIFELKGRPEGMHLAVLLAGPEQLPTVSMDHRPGVAALAIELWPGPLTLVLPGATPLVSGLGDDDGTVGVRCPDHDLVRALADRVGPLATTSANLHGHRTAATAAEIAEELPGADLVIDGGPAVGGVASTVVSLLGDDPEILRDGPVAESDIVRIW
jgi:L-threonylcarbamoyladenylate synthase